MVIRSVYGMIKLKRAYDRPREVAPIRRRYVAELTGHEQSVQPLRKVARQGPVTLVFSSHDTEHNAAVALRDDLTTHAIR